MNSFTRIGLPIFVVVAAVFGITFVRMYSPDDPDNGQNPRPTGTTKSLVRKEPLKLLLSTAKPVTANPEPWERSLTHWDPEVEVGEAGHFEFWAHNPHPEPVTVRVSDTNCQCAGVEVAAVKPYDFKDYAVVSALAGGPLGPASGPLAAIAHVTLDRRLAWSPLLDKDKDGGAKYDVTIPAADPAAGTQPVIIRLAWNPKGEPGGKEIWTKITAGVGDSQPTLYTLTAHSLAVPAFDVVRRDGSTGWAPAGDLNVGELRENGEGKRVVYLMSTTRRHLLYSLSTDRPDPCVTWTDPAPASTEEIQSLSDYFSQSGRPVRRLKSVYKLEVTVRERTETEAGGKKQFHQLDLGLLDRRLTVSAVDGGSFNLAVRARVLGDVSFLDGAPDGRVDLGNSFPVDQDRTKTVVLVAERADLNLKLAEAETTPNYMKVKLDPLEKFDGRNQWRLRVTVPKGSLYGALPPNSAVILTTAGPNPRRLRIPVRGMTYDSGGPRI